MTWHRIICFVIEGHSVQGKVTCVTAFLLYNKYLHPNILHIDTEQ